MSRLRAALAVAAPLVLLALAGPAAARAPTKKPEPGPAPTAAQKAAADKKLRARAGKPPEKLVNLWNARTKEWLAVDAKRPAKGTPAIPQAVADDFFRCHFTNQPPTTYDLRLVAIVVDAALHFGTDMVYIVSGYRAPKYNLQLRKKGREVARDSQHTYGHAIDFKLPGVATTTLRDWLKKKRLGGVGYYPESAFVHADVGKIRYWVGR